MPKPTPHLTYFTDQDDFPAFIRSALGQTPTSTTPISTGWTNFVFRVETPDGQFFFRFPRDDFWARTIVKDCAFASFIRGQTTFATPESTLHRDPAGRPFSVHRSIPGQPLADLITTLTPAELTTIGHDIADFLHQLHHISFPPDFLSEFDNIGTSYVDFLDELLRLHADPADYEFWHYEELIRRPTPCLVHGDFNLSNILTTPDRHVAAVIDFGFGSFGDKHFDLGRTFSRECPTPFRAAVLARYRELDPSIDDQLITDYTAILHGIDLAYINYMTKIGLYHP